jgi:hypothetical protein
MFHARLLRSASCLLIALGIALAGSPAQAQTVEAEPNSSCLSAQNLTGALPMTVTGSLDTPPATPDVDFYRVTATPGELLRIEMRGETAGGTLHDPFLGIQSSGCSYLSYDDDGGNGLDSRIEVTVPADGVLMVAATSAWDWELSGNGSYAGSYTLQISEVTLAEGIGGRVVDANTGAILPGSLVWLRECDSTGDCERYMGYSFTRADGTFRFEAGNYSLYDNILRSGTYQILVVSGDAYDHFLGTPFQILGGQDLDLGDIGMLPVPVVGSISARLVDAVTGVGLTGTASPFARAELQSCEAGYCSTVRHADADAQGHVTFLSNQTSPLRPGTYRVVAFAEQYEATLGAEFEVAQNQHSNLGDFGVKSYPVRFHLLQACSSVPSTGGDCPYVVRVVNGNPGKLHADVWSLVRSHGPYWSDQGTEFQVGRKTVSLLPGASTDVPFNFFVPGIIKDETTICTRVLTSHKTNAFEAIGQRSLFCIAKIGQTFRQLPDQERRELLKKVR